jgi:hypothetical protein
VIFVLWGTALGTPAWVPVALLAYAIGRRRFTIKFLLVLTTAEAAAIGFVVWMLRGDGGFILRIY